MPRFFIKRTDAKGTQPGSLIFIGRKKLENVRIRVMSYDKENLIEKECTTLDEAFSHIDGKRLTWINIDGLHDPDVIARIGSRFQIHSLLLEDIMNTDHRPKFHEEEDDLFIISKLLSYNSDKKEIESEQLSLMAGPGYVITLQERIGTYFEPVRQRIRGKKSTRLTRPDYLTFALLDCIVDEYTEIIGELGTLIEALDDKVLHNARREIFYEIYRHRTEMNFLRKTINPLKEVTSAFLRSESDIIEDKTREFLRDLNDHVILSVETIDSYLVMIMDQMNMYNANISNRANEIMKTLTIFASLFIPLTFLTGIYGMNFKFIPELDWKWGYPFFWILTLAICIGLVLFFRRRKWF